MFQDQARKSRRNGAQTDDSASAGVEQQQLLAKRHGRSHLDRSRTRGIATRRSDSSAQPWYPLREPISYMRHQQQTIQQIHSRTGW